MTTIGSSAKSGMVPTSGNEALASSENENAALFETLFGLMQTATDIPNAMEAQSGLMVDGASESGADLAFLPAIIASVPLGSTIAMPAAPKSEISDGALAMAQTLLVAQSVGLVDAVADTNADTDTPATLDLKIGSPIPALKKDHHNEPELPVSVPAELFAKARALVKGEVTSPSRNTYGTGPQPVHQLMSFLKQAVVSKDDKITRVQTLETPLSDDAMPNIVGQPAGAFVTYDAPHSVPAVQVMTPNSAPMPRIAAKVSQDIVTYNESHTVLTAQQRANLESAAPMPNIIGKSAGNLVTYDAPHTVLTAPDMIAKAAPMPTITGKAGADAVMYSEAHTVIESNGEAKAFDIVQAAKQNKAQLNNIIENGFIPSAPKDLAARASIIVDNGAIRMQSEKLVPQRMGGDTAAIIQTSESSNGSGTQNNGNRNDGGGFDQASRGNTQMMTAHRLNMADKAWHEGFVRRVENSIKNGDGVIRIALEPRQLGRMQVKLGFQGDATRIQITTETSAAAAILSENEGRLSQMLDQAGLKLGNLQTNTSGSSGFDQNNNMGGQANSGQTGTSSGNDDQSSGKNQSQNGRGEADNGEETPNTLENDNKTVLNILA